ncbi:hypothetical protein ACROYT_G015351 [Oculina patagonica]
MILDAPEWSPASVQFTHGFPRRLIQAKHGGFVPGNIIVTAKASNLSLRRLAILDVASLVGLASIAGAGLSLGRLLNLRYAAVRYQKSQSYLPHYLTRGMLEFGVNFLTFKPLEADVLVALADTIKNPWDEPVDQETGDAEFSEAEARVPAALLNRIGHRPPPEGGESAQDMETETKRN